MNTSLTDDPAVGYVAPQPATGLADYYERMPDGFVIALYGAFATSGHTGEGTGQLLAALWRAGYCIAPIPAPRPLPEIQTPSVGPIRITFTDDILTTPHP